jgi:hypothetical protein
MQLAAGIAGIFWLGWKFWLSNSIPLGVLPDQATTAMVAISGIPQAADKLFIVNYSLQAAVFRVLGLSEMSLRIYGILLVFILLAGIIKLVKKGEARESWGILMLLVCVNPWIAGLSLFHVPELLSLTTGVWMMVSGKWWSKMGWGLVTALSSPVGMTGILMWGIYQLVARREKQAIVFLVVILGMVFSNRQYLQKESGKLWISQLRPAEIANEINEEQKIYFLSTGRTYVLPALLRKAVYNKPVYILKKLVSKTAAVFDLTAWTSQQDAWVITSLSGFPPKGFLPLFYYWEIPLLMVGVLTIKNKRLLWWIIPAIIPAIFAEEKFIGTSGILMLPILLYLIWQGTVSLSRNYRRVIIVLVIGLYSIACWNFGNKLFREQEGHLKSDTQLYLRMAGWVKENLSEWNKIIVTERIGPTKLMLSFYGFKDNPKLEFRDFDLTRENPLPGSIFIGLPGEFTGPGDKANDRPVFNGRTILEKINYGDELVFNYGKGIWIGR